MSTGGRIRIATALAALATGPGVVAAQPLDPSLVVDAPPFVLALGSFAAVSLVGGVLLSRYAGFVDQSVDDAMARPRVAVLYGAMAYGIVAFLGTYAYTLLVGISVAGPLLRVLVLLGFACVALVLAALGFLVVGTLVTDLRGARRPWYGLFLGAAVSALVWVFLPFLAAVLIWFVVVAFGVGGPAREWFHTSRATNRVPSE